MKPFFLKTWINQLTEQSHIAPLALFRVIFGGMMFGSVLRFISKGWVQELYVDPVFYFTYYGFEWVRPLGQAGMYLLFAVMALSALLMMIGYLYRFSAIVFFLSFTYVELIDKTNYLNHYYFVSIIAFLMILLPAGRYFAVDTYLHPERTVSSVPRWFIAVIQLQLGMVYFFAGVAKLNYDWLVEAQPLRIWLQPHTDMPVIGYFMDKTWVAYFFSWFGAVYDLSIPFLLINKRTRGFAYFLVLVFHIMTYLLFQIGMFPYIMIVSTLIFFGEGFHVKVIDKLRQVLSFFRKERKAEQRAYAFKPLVRTCLISLLSVHFLIQVLMPFRYMLYPGKLFWTEQGFRFSWRVMLMEKAGKAFFYVRDPSSGRSGEAMMNNDLTPNQEKMMATQPDMILQYAHHLEKKYREQGMTDPEIRVEAYVTLNGSGSRPFIDKEVDLTKEKESFAPKSWVLPFEEKR